MAAAKTLYVCRPLLNADDLHEWAAAQGFRSALPKSELHVTVAFSREPFDWSDVTSKRGQLETHGGRRSVEKLGDAIVLRFASKALADRWQELRDAGASWDYPGYKPHVTIAYEGAPEALEDVKPYHGRLIFGSERFAAVDEDGNEGIRETPMASTTTQPNNATVKFRGTTEREMALDPKPAIGDEVAAPPKPAKPAGAKRLPKGTRKKARKMAQRGMISPKAMKTHFGSY